MSATKPATVVPRIFWSVVQSRFVPIEVRAAKTALWEAYDAVSREWPDIEPKDFGKLVLREWLPDVNGPLGSNYNNETPF